MPIIRTMGHKTNWYIHAAILCLIGLCVLPLMEAGAQQLAAEERETGGGAALPRQFREISLGMGLDELKTSLQADPLFNFRGDRDVSFLPAREQSLVETTGPSFIRRAFFQLRDGQVFIMAFSLNTALVDHYSVFTAMTAKYGEPSYLDPRETVWETEDIRLAIERPLTVKYIDKQVFNDIIDESALIESRQTQRRKEFLDEF